MTAPHDLDRQLDAFLRDGPTELPDPSFDEVRARMESTRQRVVIGPWRMPDMNKFAAIGLGAAAVLAVLVIGTRLLPPAPGGVGGAPSAEPTATPSPTLVGGVVQYQLDGAPATTEVDAVADGTTVSGTAVTTFVGGTHTVRLQCATRDGDYWVLGGTIEQTSVLDASAGLWSAVFVKEGSPQQLGLHLSDDEWEGNDCDAWLASIDYSSIDPSNYQPVESGALVPPPDQAP